MRDEGFRSVGESRNVVVIGGGVSGMTAAVEAAEAGAEVLLVESGDILGGRMMGMNKYFPKLDSPTAGLDVHLRRIRRNPRITALTNSDAISITGTRGDFTVELVLKPDFVNDRCNGCDKCAEVCPAEVEDKFNYGMNKTKAIRKPPFGGSRHLLDGQACLAPACGGCAEICPEKAIDLGEQPRTASVRTECVVVATGWEPFDAGLVPHLGFGAVPNVINNVQMERLVAPNGPTGGQIIRPSDSGKPNHVAFVQCAGSRDEKHLPYCSMVCCMVSLKQAVYVRDAHPDASIVVVYTELTDPSPGRYDKFLEKVVDDDNIRYLKGKVAAVSENKATGGVTVEVKKPSGAVEKFDTDMVVLATGMVPSILSEVLKEAVVLDKHGFMDPQVQKEGVYVIGTAKTPLDVTSSMLDAAGAALRTTQRIRQ
ncbi:MAG: CoB--CoM heterodisulfide reductase iron-sulfur subunit A family protein [Nitrospinae bacterium]|nr:CoB--CoM heterodisulfide reductase iron-sulfur subunit A family protein [Nitrospinota bacterium]